MRIWRLYNLNGSLSVWMIHIPGEKKSADKTLMNPPVNFIVPSLIVLQNHSINFAQVCVGCDFFWMDQYHLVTSSNLVLLCVGADCWGCYQELSRDCYHFHQSVFHFDHSHPPFRITHIPHCILRGGSWPKCVFTQYVSDVRCLSTPIWWSTHSEPDV